MYAGLAGFLLIASYFLVPETAFERPLSAYTGALEVLPPMNGDVTTLESQMPQVITQSNRPALDEEKYGPKTLRKDVRMFSKKVYWKEAYLLLKHCVEMVNAKDRNIHPHSSLADIAFLRLQQCFFPNMLVIILMNSWYLGVNIGMGTTYATLLEAPPYNWAPKWVGVAQAGQIVVAFIALPMLGVSSTAPKYPIQETLTDGNNFFLFFLFSFFQLGILGQDDYIHGQEEWRRART